MFLETYADLAWLQAATRTTPGVQHMQGANKQGASQFSFSAMPGYPHPQPAMPNQPQLQPQHGQQGAQQQQQPGQQPMHGGTPSNPFTTGPVQPTVSTGKVPMFPPSKAPGSAKAAHRTFPGGPGNSSGPGVASAKKEGTSPNLEAKDTKDGIKRSPASRPASQPSKPGAGAATPSASTGLQPGVPGGGGALSPSSLMATQQQRQQQRQNQVQASLNQSPSLLGVGVGAGGMLNGLGAGAGGIGVPSGATANPSTTLPSAGLGFDDFNHITSMGDLYNDFAFPGLDITGFGSGAEDDFMFLNMPDPMDASNLLQ